MIWADWHWDAGVLLPALFGLVIYSWGVFRYHALRKRPWRWSYTAAYVAAVGVAILAIESPLDAAADSHFAPHMVQHLMLTDIVAPLLLLGAPLKLWLSCVPHRWAKQSVAFLHHRFMKTLCSPIICWMVFIVALWGVHFSPLYEISLENETVHAGEHALFLFTAIWFWMPIIGEGSMTLQAGQLTFPLRMLYLLVAMPAEAFLGFVIYTARTILYPTYRVAGLADQQAAGEIMWVGAVAVMFVAFMLVGAEWARAEQKILRY